MTIPISWLQMLLLRSQLSVLLLKVMFVFSLTALEIIFFFSFLFHGFLAVMLSCVSLWFSFNFSHLEFRAILECVAWYLSSALEICTNFLSNQLLTWFISYLFLWLQLYIYMLGLETVLHLTHSSFPMIFIFFCLCVSVCIWSTGLSPASYTSLWLCLVCW